MIIRNFKIGDYEQVKMLYLNESTFGGQFDPDRDSFDRLSALINKDPQAILVAEIDATIVGTVSLFENGRTAWLFRYAVLKEHQIAEKMLYDKAAEILKFRGHKQVLVYSPSNDETLENRYQDLAFNKGLDYTCYWKTM